MAEEFDQVRIKRELKRRLQAHKEKSGTAMSVFIEQACEEKFKRLKSK